MECSGTIRSTPRTACTFANRLANPTVSTTADRSCDIVGEWTNAVVVLLAMCAPMSEYGLSRSVRHPDNHSHYVDSGSTGPPTDAEGHIALRARRRHVDELATRPPLRGETAELGCGTVAPGLWDVLLLTRADRLGCMGP